jgi:hypothetical protein
MRHELRHLLIPLALLLSATVGAVAQEERTSPTAYGPSWASPTSRPRICVRSSMRLKTPGRRSAGKEARRCAH